MWMACRAPGSGHFGDCNQAEPMKTLLRSAFLTLAIMALAVPANVGRLSAANIRAPEFPANVGPYEKGWAAYHRGDYAPALRIFRLLAEQGFAQAHYSLGVMYDKGRGVSQDYAEAVKWYRMAAKQGDATAQYNLGVSYDEGQGVPQDYAEAVKWYRLAADQDIAGAQYNLGDKHENGLGVPRDIVQAYMWFNIGAAVGDEEARQGQDRAARSMSPDQIGEAQRMAREWMAKRQQ
jgi:TPR repeat protein